MAGGINYYEDRQEIVQQPIDYELKTVLRSALIREAKELALKYKRRDVQDFINNTIAYLKVEK